MAIALPRVFVAAALACLVTAPAAAQGYWAPPVEPCDPDAPGEVGDARGRLQDAAEAEDPAERAAKLEEAGAKLMEAFEKGRGDVPGTWYYLGRYYVVTEDPAGADSALRRAEEMDPTCADDIATHREEIGLVAVGFGSQAWAGGNPSEAIDHFKMAALLLPSDPTPLFYIGRIFAEGREADSAAKYVSEGSRIAGDDPNHARNRRSAMRDLARVTETVAYDEALTGALQAGLARDSLARKAAGDSATLAQLVAEWSGVNLRPEQLEAYQSDSAGRAEALAQTTQARDRYAAQFAADSAAGAPLADAAAEALRDYWVAFPDDADAGGRLIRLLGAAGRRAAAAEASRRFVGSDLVSDPEIIQAGMGLFNEGRYDTTVDLLEEAAQRNPNLRNTLYILARSYYVLGDGEKLLATAKTLAGVDPLNAQSMRMMAAGWELEGTADSVQKYVALANGGIQWTVDVIEFTTQGGTSVRASVRNVSNGSLPATSLVFEFLDARGTALYGGTAAVSALAAGGQQEIQVQLPETGAVAWRYRPAS